MKVHNGQAELRLTDEQVERMIQLASERPPVYFLFRLMGQRGLRVSAITGDNENRQSYRVRKEVEQPDGTIILHYVDTKKVYPARPGLLKEDVTSEGVSVHWKGQGTQFKYLPPSLAKELHDYALTLAKGERIVPFTRRRAHQLCQEYARRAGVEHWNRVHPHRFRHYFGTFHARRTGRDTWKVKSLMGHKSLQSTATYVEELSPEEELAELSG